MPETLNQRLGILTARHREALEWFLNLTGRVVPWPDPLPDGTLLVTKAKGIYKPEWSEYALSVRQTLGGPYPDKDPVVRPDGTWLYAYFQENDDPNARDQEYTNRALMACLRDRVPVGVMRQVSPKPNVRYRVLGLALVTSWDGGYFYLEGFSPQGLAQGAGPKAELDLISSNEQSREEQSSAFDPADAIDARHRTMAAIVRRRGQPAFRKKLLEIYSARCAITGCDITEVLEAAHITPYLGPETNHPTNGLLLRADLHTLFDLGLIAIDPTTMAVVLAESLRMGVYAAIHGQKISLPELAQERPSAKALAQHREWCGF